MCIFPFFSFYYGLFKVFKSSNFISLPFVKNGQDERVLNFSA